MTQPATTDTIAAIATPLGQGGVGIIRISGPESHRILCQLFVSSNAAFKGFCPRVLHHGRVHDGCAHGGTEPHMLDDVLAVHMPAPNTFTGEDVVEINCHGGPAILAAVLDAVLKKGARPAAHGEFTKRAFLNGRMDLTQAEAVAEMIAAPASEGVRLAQARLNGMLGQYISALRERLELVRVQLCVAVDFPDDEVECLAPEEFMSSVDEASHSIRTLIGNYERARCWREGAQVVLAGQVNAGKSSLMNAMLGRRRAIVTDVPGTTRDFLEESIVLDGLSVRLVDTAGLRETGDIVEQEGVRMSRDLAAQADLVLLVVDATRGIGTHESELLAGMKAGSALVVLNKAELLSEEDKSRLQSELAPWPVVAISAKQGQGIDVLSSKVREMVLERSGAAAAEATTSDLAPNLRQTEALRRALEELEALSADIDAGVPYDLAGVRLETVCAVLTEITGETTPDEILNKIFDSFCIGK
ncbi:tRNA uridine-5-carboxymethylaminomethyl(34) synthesis GTPase MnmE [Oleidesulfovibrio sp.]|uniref:tRNA uridine-5-carboxymethylaminomethyl(34) synthesis GTPase MnmE n=1 Tax=Oleidesulfovibrio sp. TaxID=2909707 RepID=UPI003A862E6B